AKAMIRAKRQCAMRQTAR
ncbi:rod binding family protein, partial [Vibrio parahaemolyticus V-223/04]